MVGKTISRYQVLEKIGQGGMGTVHLAGDTNWSREVAIKVLPEQFTKDLERRADSRANFPRVFVWKYQNCVRSFSALC